MEVRSVRGDDKVAGIIGKAHHQTRATTLDAINSQSILSQAVHQI